MEKGNLLVGTNSDPSSLLDLYSEEPGQLLDNVFSFLCVRYLGHIYSSLS